MVWNLQEIYKILIWLEIYKKFTRYRYSLKFTRNLQDIDMVGKGAETVKLWLLNLCNMMLKSCRPYYSN